MTAYAHFTDDGQCFCVTATKASDAMGVVPVPDNTAPGDIFLAPCGKVELRVDAEPLPARVAVGFVWEDPALDDTAIFVDAQPVSFPHVFGQPGQVIVEMRGRYRLHQFVQIQSYAEERAAAYPSIPEQLDALYHGGFEAWRDTIAAVKAAHPKPTE